MKKIISTLTAMTFALGLAAAAQAQIAKTPEKPEVKSTQAQTQVTPKEAVKTGEPAVKEAVKTGDQTKEMVKPGDQEKAKQKVKKETKKVTKPGQAEKKAGAPLATTPAAK